MQINFIYKQDCGAEIFKPWVHTSGIFFIFLLDRDILDWGEKKKRKKERENKDTMMW